jgi:MoxR-like ATPase
VCLLARGHLLIEDVPGVGKTTLAQALARSVSCTFHRLQFTSDMLPSDVLGVTIYNAHSELFEFRRGPIFTNFLLADEINRTTPRTQSALLEAMNEQQVTIDGREILRNSDGYFADTVQAALSADEVIELQNMAQRVTVESSLVDYMLAIVARTRAHESLALGVSPRGSQALFRASQAMALIEGRDYVVPHDIKRLAVPIFGHRVVVSTRASLAQRTSDLGERIIEEILQHVDVPL